MRSTRCSGALHAGTRVLLLDCDAVRALDDGERLVGCTGTVLGRAHETSAISGGMLRFVVHIDVLDRAVELDDAALLGSSEAAPAMAASQPGWTSRRAAFITQKQSSHRGKGQIRGLIRAKEACEQISADVKRELMPKFNDEDCGYLLNRKLTELLHDSDGDAVNSKLNSDSFIGVAEDESVLKRFTSRSGADSIGNTVEICERDCDGRAEMRTGIVTAFRESDAHHAVRWIDDDEESDEEDIVDWMDFSRTDVVELGEVVWAKTSGSRYWPAQLVHSTISHSEDEALRSPGIPVRLCATLKETRIELSDIKSYAAHFSNFSKSKILRKRLDEAIEQANKARLQRCETRRSFFLALAHNQQVDVQKRLTPAQWLDCTIWVWWPLDHAWYPGLVRAYDPQMRRYFVVYDDGVEWLKLEDEKIVLLPPGANVEIAISSPSARQSPCEYCGGALPAPVDHASVSCDICGISVHLLCSPRQIIVDDGTHQSWICTSCMECRSCGQRPPIDASESILHEWTEGLTMCGSCSLCDRCIFCDCALSVRGPSRKCSKCKLMAHMRCMSNSMCFSCQPEALSPPPPPRPLASSTPRKTKKATSPADEGMQSLQVHKLSASKSSRNTSEIAAPAHGRVVIGESSIKPIESRDTIPSFTTGTIAPWVEPTAVIIAQGTRISHIDLCVACASSGDPAEFLCCADCGEVYHWYCTGDVEQHYKSLSRTLAMRQVTEQRRRPWSWRCPDCVLCTICGSADRAESLLQCDLCDAGSHFDCLKFDGLPERGFRCGSCAQCRACGTKTAKQWRDGCTLCEPCGVLYDHRQYCPICRRTWRHDEDADMVCCDNCDMWVHAECDPTRARDMNELAAQQYFCPLCRPPQKHIEPSSTMSSSIANTAPLSSMTFERLNRRRIELQSMSLSRVLDTLRESVMWIQHKRRRLRRRLLLDSARALSRGNQHVLLRGRKSSFQLVAIPPYPSSMHANAATISKDVDGECITSQLNLAYSTDDPTIHWATTVAPLLLGNHHNNDDSIAGSSLMIDMRTCSLCGKQGDDEMGSDRAGRLLLVDAYTWVHARCAMWSAEVSESNNSLGRLSSVDVAVARGAHSVCYICERNGATLRCCARGCSREFHFGCGRLPQRNCWFLTDFRTYCHEHLDGLNELVLNTLDAARLQRPLSIGARSRFEDIPLGAWLRGGSHQLDNDPALRIGALTVHELGRIESGKPFHNSSMLFPIGYHASRIAWAPIIDKQTVSSPNAHPRRVVYTCRIIAGRAKHMKSTELCPLFVITSHHLPDMKPIRCWTPNEAWKKLMDRIPTFNQRNSNRACIVADHCLKQQRRHQVQSNRSRQRLNKKSSVNRLKNKDSGGMASQFAAFGLCGAVFFGFGHPRVAAEIERLPGVDNCVNYVRRYTSSNDAILPIASVTSQTTESAAVISSQLNGVETKNDINDKDGDVVMRDVTTEGFGRSRRLPSRTHS